MSLNGSRRIAGSLPNDPRSRRGGGGGQIVADLSTYVAAPIGLDERGKLSLVPGRAQPGYVLVWDGREAVWRPRYMPTPVKTGAYTAKPGELVLCDPSSAGFTVTLPPASTWVGDQIDVKNDSASTNTITVSGHGQDMIDGASSATIAAARASLSFRAVAPCKVVVV